MSKLSDAFLRSVKPKDKVQKYFDGGGLYLYVTPKGGKLWRIDYRHEGKYQTLSLGAYPTIPLIEARRALQDLKIKLKQGVNPSAEKQEAIATVKAEREHTLEKIALEWIDKNKEVWAKKHLETTLGRLKVNVFPLLGGKYIGNITAPELLECLRKAEARGRNETAHRALSICGQVFRYAIATGGAERDISQDLRGALAPVKKKNFASITDEKELGLLLNNIDNYTGG